MWFVCGKCGDKFGDEFVVKELSESEGRIMGVMSEIFGMVLMFVQNEYFDWFEVELIYIICEVVVECCNLVLLFLGGKDLIVMLYLVFKVFCLGDCKIELLFLLVYIDMGYNYLEVIIFCDEQVVKLGVCFVVGYVEDFIKCGIVCLCKEIDLCNVVQVVMLLEIIELYGFDVLMGGVCCDEEKVCVKECIFLFCDEFGQWDLKVQCLEFWSLYNVCMVQGEQMCVFLIFNWMEFDVWQYIVCENLVLLLIYYVY